MKKILMSVVTLIALAVVFTGCAAKRDNVSTVNQTSTEVESELQEKDSTKPSQIIYCSEDWENLDKQKDLITEVLSTRQEGALQYEPHGIYTLYDESFKTYTFEAPNDFYQVVMMNNDETFRKTQRFFGFASMVSGVIFILHNTGNHGVSFQSIVYKEGKFVGLTSNYALFETADGTVKAVSIKEKEDCQIGEYQFDVFDFNELSLEEQESAIYPNGWYFATF